MEDSPFDDHPDLDGPAPGPPSPVVVVHERPGWSSLLLPPCLVLLAAMIVLELRPRGPDPSFLRPTMPPPVAGLARPSPPTEAPPVVVRAEPAPTPAPAPADEPAPPPPAPAPPAIVAEAPAPPAAVVAAEAAGPWVAQDLDPEPLPEPPAQGLEDFAREAERLRLQELRMEALRAEVERDERVAALRRAKTARADFHADLRAILAAGPTGAAESIEALCDRHGRGTADEVERALARARANRAGRLARRDRIAMLRRLGLPEAMILDDLAHDQARLIGSRTGPADRPDALVRAARLLLSNPPQAPVAARPK